MTIGIWNTTFSLSVSGYLREQTLILQIFIFWETQKYYALYVFISSAGYKHFLLQMSGKLFMAHCKRCVHRLWYPLRSLGSKQWHYQMNINQNDHAHTVMHCTQPSRGEERFFRKGTQFWAKRRPWPGKNGQQLTGICYLPQLFCVQQSTKGTKPQKGPLTGTQLGTYWWHGRMCRQ